MADEELNLEEDQDQDEDQGSEDSDNSDQDQRQQRRGLRRRRPQRAKPKTQSADKPTETPQSTKPADTASPGMQAAEDTGAGAAGATGAQPDATRAPKVNLGEFPGTDPSVTRMGGVGGGTGTGPKGGGAPASPEAKPEFNPYKVLGVDKDADAGDIRKAYRGQAKENHPDVSKDPDATAKFQDINKAHEVLSDPAQRQFYDQNGRLPKDYEPSYKGWGKGSTPEAAAKTPGVTPAATTPSVAPVASTGVTGSAGASGATTGAAGTAEAGTGALQLAGGAAEAGGLVASGGATGLTTSTTETAGAAATAAEVSNPIGWVMIILQIAVVAFFSIFGLVMAFQAKNNSLVGGTIDVKVDYRKAEHQQLVTDVVELTKGLTPKLQVADGAREDLDWYTDKSGKKAHHLDFRTLQTIKYLSNQWDVLGIRTLVSNGPDRTQRIEKKANGETVVWESNSAFASGQAVAIDKIGRVSVALANLCFAGVRVPVEVSWQKMTREATMRPLYEQLSDDARVYIQTAQFLGGQSDLNSAADFHEQSIKRVAEQTAKGETPLLDKYMVAEERLKLLGDNLRKLSGMAVVGGGVYARTAQYAGSALTSVDQMQASLQGKTGIDYVTAWTTEEFQAAMTQATNWTYRALQVANRPGFRNILGVCDYLKAHEADQNIRQLVAQVMYMPVGLAGPKDNGFNRDMVAKQVIVYNPQDDLDNGLAGTDTYPNAGVLVDEGGVAFKGVAQADGTLKVGDGRLDDRDSQFKDLPLDNGVFSKASTTFLFDKRREGILEKIAQIGLFGLDDAVKDFYNAWDGEIKPREGYEAVKVSYKDFVYIAF